MSLKYCFTCLVLLGLMFILGISLLLLVHCSHGQFGEDEALEYINSLDNVFCGGENKAMTARWNYITNITTENEIAMNEARLEFQKTKKEVTQNISSFDWDSFEDSDLVRRAKFYKSMGSNITEEQLQQMNELGTKMESTYSTAKICRFDEDPDTCTPSLELEPDLTEIFATSTNAAELKHSWKAWREASGNKYRQDYLDFIEINNEAAKSLGFSSLKDQWIEMYENADFPGLIQNVWTQTFDIGGKQRSLELFFKQFHAFVRSKLKDFYSDQDVDIHRFGYIPAHLLGNMWAQQWGNIENIVKPFNNTTILDVTDEMVAQNYTADKMFHLAEEFFQSIGFDGMTDTFWEKSMITKPDGRDVVCHASAEDFYEENDYRIKMCTAITHSDLVTVHHEMGHIEYFMEYADKPFIYRTSANPGFHEAIGDTMALSVNTPAHLEGLGLLPSGKKAKTVFIRGKEVPEDDLGYLFHVALDKLTFLPFAYTMDSWRWKLFTGEIDNTNMNSEWWKLRENLQGLTAPVERSETDFDPGAKYHIPANVPYIRYFVSFIVQFQFYEALCKEAGQYVENDPAKPLYLCDFSKGGASTGDLIKNVMRLGFSKSWPEALNEITGSPDMSGESFIKYFLPLYDFLEQENSKRNECIGWGADCEEHARRWLDDVYEETIRSKYEFSTQKDWEYNTNINQETQDASNAASEEVAKYIKSAWKEYVTQYDYEEFSDPDIKRRLQIMSTLGTAALEDDRFAQMNNIVSNMTSIYGAGKVCPFDKQDCDLATEGMTLEPGLEDILANTATGDWDELVYVWKGWRDASGKKMREQYKNYIDITNEAARANGLADASEMWLDDYTSDLSSDDDFRADLEDIWSQMQPLYERIHAYVRYKFREHWGEERFGADEPIPAHIFGNMWAQSWKNVFKVVSPFPNVSSPLDEVNANLVKQNYTERMIHELSNSFYTNLGLEDMTMCFDTPCGTENTPENHECMNNNPMIRKPDWDVVCHASAWDMFHMAKDDYRIKMCTEVNLEDLVTVHHEMGHIQYFIQYENLPMQYRDGANGGFHEAIGDTMALSVQTPMHLNSVGLLDEVPDTPEADLNFLLSSAMERVCFLPFAYTIDQYRWALFNGTFSTEELTYKWWELRERYQGIVPPVMRSESDFDAGAKYHVASSVSYIRYFVAHILEYQFYKEMCLTSGQYDPNDPNKPLFKCDFSNGELAQMAGAKMKTMLQAGKSKPWPDTLEAMTGTRKMDASAILEYFAPLSDWLEKELTMNNIPRGWKSTFGNWIET